MKATKTAVKREAERVFGLAFTVHVERDGDRWACTLVSDPSEDIALSVRAFTKQGVMQDAVDALKVLGRLEAPS